MTARPDISVLVRWRLILGEAAESACRGAGGQLDGDGQAMDEAMEWLYGRESDGDDRQTMRRGGRKAP